MSSQLQTEKQHRSSGSGGHMSHLLSPCSLQPPDEAFQIQPEGKGAQVVLAWGPTSQSISEHREEREGEGRQKEMGLGTEQKVRVG